MSSIKAQTNDHGLSPTRSAPAVLVLALPVGADLSRQLSLICAEEQSRHTRLKARHLMVTT
jgi:hypothetical protein